MALKYLDMELEPDGTEKRGEKKIDLFNESWKSGVAIRGAYIEEQCKSVNDEPNLVDERQANRRNAVKRHLATNRRQ